MIRAASALCLSGVLLADAGIGSCNGNSRSVLVLSAVDCSCLPATVRVEIAGEPTASVELQCGRTTPIAVYGGGTRRVVVTQGSVRWHDAQYTAFDGDEVPVPIRCPGR